MLSRITAKITESWQPPETAVERGEAALQAADNYYKEGRQLSGANQNQAFEQALGHFNTAKAALKRGVRCGREAESRPVLGEVYQKQAELWRQQGADVEVVRERYRKAREYFSDPERRAAVQGILNLLSGAPAPGLPQIRRPISLRPSSVTPASTLDSTGIPAPFFENHEPSACPPYALVEPAAITDTQHLAWCLQQTYGNGPQQELQTRVSRLVTPILKKFGKSDKTLFYMREAAALATIPQAETYGLLVDHTLEALGPKHALNIAAVQGLVVIVQNCPTITFLTSKWTKVFQTLRAILNNMDKENPVPVLELMQAISQLLDTMGQAGVSGISRERLQQPLYQMLRDGNWLNPTEDVALSWQIRYACEALAYIPNDESKLEAVLRCFSEVSKVGLATQTLNVNLLRRNFGNFHDALTDLVEVVSSSTATKCNQLREAVQNARNAEAELERGRLDTQNRRHHNRWYVALQYVELLIQANQLEKFETLVRNSAYRQSADFLQGVCQCLERLACTQENTDVPRKAIQFLQSLRDDTAHWMQKEGVLSQVQQSAAVARLRQGVARELNKTLGTSLMFQPEVTQVNQYAAATLARLEARADPSNTYVPPAWDPFWKGRPDTELLEAARRKLTIPLKDRLLKSLSADIQKLQITYVTGQEQDNEIRDALAHYVSPDGVLINAPNYDAENRFNLYNKVCDFLELDTKKVLLLQGEAGLGKSTFSWQFARSRWKAYISLEDAPIPVFITLSSLKSANHNRVIAFFESLGFSTEEIQTLRATERFVFILDGFDNKIEERQRSFYTDNELDKWTQAKVIITSRPEYLGSGYQRKFYPSGQPEALQEYRLAPFSEPLIEQYVDKYKKAHPQSEWTADEYKTRLKRSDLSTLVSNPFVLKMALSGLSKPGDWLPFTRIALYDRFVQDWFKRSQQRLGSIELTPNFVINSVDFSKRFATALYRARDEVTTYVAAEHAPWEEANIASQQPDWRDEFLGDGDVMTELMRLNTSLMRLNAPLIHQGDQYKFIHKSIRDYFVARSIWESKLELSLVKKTVLLNQSLVKDPAVLDFLVERVRQEPEFKAQLLNFIEHYSKREDMQIASANTLTILVRAGVPFSAKDFSEIWAAGADLSYGIFDHTKFNGADLSGVNLQGAWLRGAQLHGTKLAGVEFGEKPTLKVGAEVRACTYSPNGGWLAVGTEEGWIQLYEAESLELLDTYEGHRASVTSVSFSQDGQWLASGSDDGSVKLWSVAPATRGLPPHTYEGHARVMSVSFSQNGDWLVSGSSGHSVRLWSVAPATCGLPSHTYEGHRARVTSVSFSRDGRWLASASSDESVKLWSLASATYSLAHTYEGHRASVTSVSFSRKGKQLASGSDDQSVRLWSVENARHGHTVGRHNSGVTSVSLSRDGQWLASGSSDNSVKIWCVGSAMRDPVEMYWHSGVVTSVSFSPDSNWLASGSSDNSVRLWSIERSEMRGHTYKGHSASVNSVSFSPDSKWLASGSDDQNVNLWSVESATRGAVCTYPHNSAVTSVSFSPDSNWLASGGWDGRIKLWLGSGECVATIEDCNGPVRSVAWQEEEAAKGYPMLAIGGEDKAVRLWQIEQEGSRIRVILSWTSYQAKLTVRGASVIPPIEPSERLSSMNARLLQQGGAVMSSEEIPFGI